MGGTRRAMALAHTALAAVALLAGAVLPLDGQRARHFEIGAFGSYTSYEEAFGLDDKFGGGVRFGYLLSERFSLELDAVFQPRQTVSGTSVGVEPLIFDAGVGINLPPLARNSFFLLAGYSLLDFGTTAPLEVTDHGLHVGLGDRILLGERTALRLEGRFIYVPSTEAPVGGSATHFLATAGISLFHGERRPRADADQDRVEDRKDACPDTPLGATVDARGCPADADGDRVWNGLDQCPDTPAGASVDIKGCPADGDADKVLDGVDQCPDTPRGATVDVRGCPSDSDGDKVYDGIDVCPETLAGAVVDARGCALDTDGDAVFDGLDRCPDTPAGLAVDATGCPRDSDRDGVHDGIDQCPGTPAGTPVNPQGCPMVGDADGDAVEDRRDRCPNTPRNTRVDDVGCPILFREEASGRVAPLVLRGVTFQTGRSALTTTSYAVLDQVAGSLVAHPEVRIEIAGHTDNTGSVAVNRRLSLARAAAVRAYLARRGVRPDRMVARGYGPARPVATNGTAAGRAQNRRVELVKLP